MQVGKKLCYRGNKLEESLGENCAQDEIIRTDFSLMASCENDLRSNAKWTWLHFNQRDSSQLNGLNCLAIFTIRISEK